MKTNLVTQCVISQLSKAQRKTSDPKTRSIVFACMYPLLWINDCINTQGFLLNESIPKDKTYRHRRKHIHKKLCEALKQAEKKANNLAASEQSAVRLADYYSFLDSKMEKDIEMLHMQIVNYCTKNQIQASQELYYAMMIDTLCQFGREVSNVFCKIVSEEIGIPYTFTKDLSMEAVHVLALQFIELYTDDFDYVYNPHVITCTNILYNKITDPNIFIEAMDYSKEIDTKQETA